MAQFQPRWPTPFAPAPLQSFHHYYEAVRPSPAHRYFRPRGGRRLRLFPWHRRPGSHVPYKSLVELRATYTPDAARAAFRTAPELLPEEGSAPGFDIVQSDFDASSVVRLRSPLSTLPAGIIVPTFPQRSPPWLLTTAACGSLGSAPDRRTRRALLHLSYSCAPPFGLAKLVTQDPTRSSPTFSLRIAPTTRPPQSRPEQVQYRLPWRWQE